MKKIKAFLKEWATVLVGVALIVAFYLIEPNTRTITGTYNNGTITTKDGNVWKVSNHNGISTNKSVKVTIKFDTKGTDSVLDDEIVEIKEAN
jgi:hypothetical protein